MFGVGLYKISSSGISFIVQKQVLLFLLPSQIILSGQKDWDEELLNLIDPVSEASNDDEVNKILYEWFEGLGDTDYGTDFYDLSWENAAEDDKLFLADTTWRDDPEYLGEDLSSALMEIDEVPTIYRGNAPMFITRDQISIASFDNEF